MPRAVGLMSLLGALTAADGDFDAPAVTVAGVALTRGELLSAAAAVAGQVGGAGVVAIHADASVETIVAVVGCLLAGVVAVPVPPDSGPRERAHLLADSRAELWLSAKDAAVPGDVALPAVPVAARTCGDFAGVLAHADPELALLMYTSGTTGAPKGVPLSRSAIAACLDGLAEAWAWTPADVLAHGLPLFHVHGLILGVLGALRVGSPLHHTGRPTPAAYAAARASLYFGVPTVWGRVAADPSSARALRGARLLVSGSAGLPSSVFADLLALAGQGPVERYGMTETLITLAARADGPRRPGWVGAPIAGVEARLVDDEGRAAPADGESIGNLQVRGATVFTGYLGDSAAAAESERDRPAAVSADGWFDTGDAAVVDGDGQHRIVGRARDDLIKSGGYRIGAGEIEAVLLGHPSVAEVAVVGVADSDLGQRIIAYVVGADVQPQVLIDLVAHELSAHKRPREVRVVDSLPRNAMGKVQKSQLK